MNGATNFDIVQVQIVTLLCVLLITSQSVVVAILLSILMVICKTSGFFLDTHVIG